MLLRKMMNWPLEGVRDGKKTVISFDSLFTAPNLQRKLDHICLLNIFLIH